ncbi:MAG: SDR family oxidoreductase [Clostridia bacterium]|nr:SDR family oxidoreductase [Clostridia bacterium]
MKALLIGGTGTISTSISRKLIADGHELYLLNRGSRNDLLGTDKVQYITCDINDEAAVLKALGELEFDVVADFIAFEREHLERDYRIFKDRVGQFIFISSASAYQKPLSNYLITESTPLANPFWQYSRDKIECEKYLMDLYREEGFPVTIIRPSHTYDVRSVPLGVHGDNGSWQVIRRMMDGKPVIVHGDGTSLWTMTSAKDFAVGFVGIMNNIHAIGETFHITSDESLTWEQIYLAIGKALNVKPDLRFVSSELLAECSQYDFNGALLGDKARSVVFDNSKIKRAVPEFVCTTRFDQGIKETIDYILAHPEYQLVDEEFDAWCDRLLLAIEKLKLEMK